ncbi:MAG: YybH family protein, partial [Terriglobia bacterium]
LTLACQPQAPPDTRAADARAIRAAEAEAVKALDAKDVEGYLNSYTDDAFVFPPNAPIVTGKEAIRVLLSALAENPGFGLSVQPTKVEVARSGDLAYLVGTYELTLNDPQGKRVTEHGKYVDVWKKQPNGAWKHVIDIWNSDQPLPAMP